MTEPLSFRQIRFASLQFPRRIFLLGDIQCIPDQPHNFAILKHWFAGAVHRPLAMFRVIDAIVDIAVHTLGKHPADQFIYGVTIVRKQDAEPFLQCRDAISGIKPKIENVSGDQ